jgi:predicted TIM-barrel fold metal-dependent hydrolase
MTDEQARKSEWLLDVHHHLYPPRYVQAALPRLLQETSLMEPSRYTGWSPKVALEQMEAANVGAAVVSMTSPAVWWNNGDEARHLARECNEFGARMIADHLGRFGMLATIPLPDIDGSLQELSYALDTLKLDGIGLLTSYAGKGLGDPAFAPVLDELNRRGVTIHVHPTMTIPGLKIPGIDPPTIDYPTDTTKTIASLAFSGTFARCSNIRFIFSHGGGTLPMIAQRLAGATRALSPQQREEFFPDGLEAVLKRQFYDIASVATNPAGMAALLELIPASQIVYGSDAPFASAVVMANSLAKFDLPATDIAAIRRNNALKLFPRFAGASRH